MRDDPELQRLLDEVQERKLDPLTAVREILEKVFRVDDERSPTLADIEAARDRIAGHARVTPVYSSETLGRRSGARRVAEGGEPAAHRRVQGARRGQQARRRSTTAERAAGVIAASAGNHGQAVAWAARELGIKATVFMPQDAPMAKVDATRNYGAETVLAGAGFDEALGRGDDARARRRARRSCTRSRTRQVIAGQGTIGLELAEQLPDVETFVLPIGGGGLAAGIAIALRALRPDVRLVGVQAGKTTGAARSPTASR